MRYLSAVSISVTGQVTCETSKIRQSRPPQIWCSLTEISAGKQAALHQQFDQEERLSSKQRCTRLLGRETATLVV